MEFSDSRVWARRSLRYRYSHLLVRFIAVVGLGNFALTEVYPPYFYKLERGWAGEVMAYCSIASIFLLPLLVGVEFWWMRKTNEERKALRIDALFAGVFSAGFFGH